MREVDFISDTSGNYIYACVPQRSRRWLKLASPPEETLVVDILQTGARNICPNLLYICTGLFLVIPPSPADVGLATMPAMCHLLSRDVLVRPHLTATRALWIGFPEEPRAFAGALGALRASFGPQAAPLPPSPSTSSTPGAVAKALNRPPRSLAELATCLGCAGWASGFSSDR